MFKRLIRTVPTLAFFTLAALAVGCDAEPFVETPRAKMPKTESAIELGSTKQCKDDLGTTCAGDRAPHKVMLNEFNMDLTEVTQLQYEWCRKKGACKDDPIGGYTYTLRNTPVLVNRVESARQYCAWRGLALPTEAEFEYASRYGSDSKLHDFPWGDLAADGTADKSHTGGGLTDVGQHADDVNGAGIKDLAGSVPEWVEDDYAPMLGCLDRVQFVDVCGSDSSCPEARCGADVDNCLRGCLPGPVDSSDAPVNGADPKAPICTLPAIGSAPAVNPLGPSGSNEAVWRGGLFSDRACTLAGWTRRHTEKNNMKRGAGFRCVERKHETVRPASYRFTVQGCPTPDYAVRIAFTDNTATPAPYAVLVNAWPSQLGPVKRLQPLDGVLENARCGDTFIVEPLVEGTIKVSITDYNKCAIWGDTQQIVFGNDVPQVPRALPLMGADAKSCSIASSPGTCSGGSCKTTCAATDWAARGEADPGIRDCNAQFIDGCEINTTNDVKNCGACGKACPSPTSATVVCQQSVCKVSTCINTAGTNRVDCDQDPATGCEVDQNSDPDNCGGCRVMCSPNHVPGRQCSLGTCTGACAPGWGDCNNNKQTDGCETSLTTTQNCGACGNACGIGQLCINGACI